MLPNSSCLRSPGSTIILLLLLTSCANSPVGQSLQRSLEADPQLEENNLDLVSTGNPTPLASVELPKDFPFEIPLYEGAQLLDVEEISELDPSMSSDVDSSDTQSSVSNSAETELPPPPSTNTPTPENSEATETDPVPEPPKMRSLILTRWQTDDTPEQVTNFYQSQFQENNWQFIDQQGENPSDDLPNNIMVRQEDLEVTVSIIKLPDEGGSEKQTPTPLSTQYLIEYHRRDPDPMMATVPETTSETPSETDPETASETDPETASDTASSTDSTDSDRAPEPLRKYIRDLASLGIFQNPGSGENKSTPDRVIQPNQIITRRKYAQWLMQANNKIYAHQPTKQIRLATTNSQAVFKDVPSNDPDFAIIQGLAEAGIIPSPLNGQSTTVTFSPDQPLTRQELILWKVPLDVRRSLPTASVDAVKETWGFQDASKIDPKALRAVLADYQNGDFSNIRRTFGYTALFQPQKSVTRAEAAAVLWYFGLPGDGRSAEDALALESSQSNE